MWLAHNAELPHHPVGEWGDVFGVTEDGRVWWVGNRPDITSVPFDLLEVLDDHIGWDGNHLTMPGDLCYRPMFVNLAGDAVVARRVGP